MRMKLFEISTQLEYIDMNKVIEVLDLRDSIRDWAYIIHDKDTDVSPHVHVCCRLKNSYDSKYIAEWFGVGEQYVERVKGRWSDMLKYLIHENAPQKYQYSPDEVVSNFDWVKAKDKNSRKEEIIQGVVDGVIREYNYFNYMTVQEYDKYKKSIDNAFKYRSDVLMSNNDRNMEVVYICGESGCGKTSMAKKMASEKGSYFVSSGSNDILDGYKGQDVIILDDLRASSIGLSDLLKMLDNHTASTVKSRYRNKVLECKLIIITSVLPIDKFYKNVFESEDEPIKQFKRRCKTYVKMDIENMEMYVYDEEMDCYDKMYTLPNVILSDLKKEELTQERKKELLRKTFKGVVDFGNYMTEHIDKF